MLYFNRKKSNKKNQYNVLCIPTLVTAALARSNFGGIFLKYFSKTIILYSLYDTMK